MLIRTMLVGPLATGFPTDGIAAPLAEPVLSLDGAGIHDPSTGRTPRGGTDRAAP
jgi:hypothetical protein